MLACFRQGFVVLPCTEQLRPKDLAQRLAVAQPRIVVADVRNAATLQEAGWSGDTLWVPFEEEAAHAPPHAELAPEDPCLITFTSGTAGEPKAVLHGQRYLTGQRLQAEHWLAPEPGRARLVHGRRGLVEVGPQRVHRALAPRRGGAAARRALRPAERLELIAREQVDVLCMAPTEYRVIAKRVDLRRCRACKGVVAAGEALNPEVLHAWHEAIGLWIRDGYGQTETGQLTGAPLGETPRPGSMGKPLPGVRLDVVDGELVLAPRDRPDVLRALPRRRAARRPLAHGRPGHPRRGRLPALRGPHRRRDHLRRLPDRPVRGRVRARRAPGRRRGGGRRRAGRRARLDRPRRRRAARRLRALRTLVKELQDHVKGQTAPYKYPRMVDFAADLPKTAPARSAAPCSGLRRRQRERQRLAVRARAQRRRWHRSAG